MLSTGTNSRDPRLAGRDPTLVRDEMRKNAARPLKRLQWTRSHPSSHAHFNFLLITNLNDNVSVPLLTSELSQIGTVRRVTIPTINGRSAGIASVRLPSAAKPQQFVSKFNGYALFGKHLCVKPDRHATQFTTLLHQLNNPKPTNDDSTPPAKDTQADSNSPNWSIASQSDPDVSPHAPSAQPKRISFHVNSPAGKRPRPHRESNFLTPHETNNANCSNNPDMATRNDSRHHISNITQPRQHLHQDIRSSLPPLERSNGYEPPVNPPRPNSHYRNRVPYDSSRDRYSWHRRNEPHSPHALHRHHSRSRYLRYNDDFHSRRFRSRDVYPSPERHYKDVYRDHRGRSTPERRFPYSLNTANERIMRPTGRANRQEHHGYPPISSSIGPSRRPAIVLSGVPSSITPAEILFRFRDFRPERVVRDANPGDLILVFSHLTDREDALRDGCFIMKGKHVSPDPILTAIGGTSSYSARISSSPKKPDTDGQRAIPHRTPQRLTYESKRETDSKRHRPPLARSERRLQEVRPQTLGNGSASPEGSRSHRNLKAPRSPDQRGQEGSQDKHAQSQKELKDRSTPHTTEIKTTSNLGKVFEASHDGNGKLQDNGFLNSLKPSRCAERQSNDANEERSSTSRLLVNPGKSEVMPKQVEKTASIKQGQEPENSKSEREQKSLTEDELFEEVLRYTVDIVSKQHAELEVQRCSGLVAKPVFDYMSLRKKEEQKRACEVRRKAVLDVIHKIPPSTNATKQKRVLKHERNMKGSDSTDGHDSTAEQDSESPRKRRRTRFSDATHLEKKDVLEGVVSQNTDYSLDNRSSESARKKKNVTSINDDVSGEDFEISSRHPAPASINESERSNSTASKVSNDFSNEDHRVENGNNQDSDVKMDESQDINSQVKDASTDHPGFSQDAKHGGHEDTFGEESASQEKMNESNATHKSAISSSTFAQETEGSPSKPKIQSAFSTLDKELERKVPVRSVRSSSLCVVQSDSVVPSLKLRLPLPTRLGPTTSDRIETKHSSAAEENKRSKSKKSVPSTKKASRKASKSSKVKKKTKNKKSSMSKAAKKAKLLASSTSISSGECPEVSSSAVLSLIQTVLSTDESKKQMCSASNGVPSTDLENQDKIGHNDVQGEDSVDCNEGDEDGTCARTLIYRRDQNRNRSRKKLRLDNVVGKSVRSSRQCRQETRLYKKGISQIKPKNDDFINLNSLQQRWKKVQFDRSQIHGMGLYAKEHIETDEFVIEYIGDLVRRTVADLREKEYTRQGMGDSYLFRLDSEMVVDATRRGGIARFINHSCNPNLIARTISVHGRSTIAFYSKRTINVGEELTYDYKFDYEAEDKKIPCLCNAFNCRKYLN